MGIANVKIEPMTATFNSVALGCLDGEIEFSVTPETEDITCHANGAHVLGMISKGISEMTVTLKLKEYIVANLKMAFGGIGDTITPGGGSEVIGIGNSLDFTQLQSAAHKLILHPKVLGASDYTRDVCFWKALPIVDGLTFSGDSIALIPVTFRIFPDDTKVSEVQYMCIGDHTQAGLTA